MWYQGTTGIYIDWDSCLDHMKHKFLFPSKERLAEYSRLPHPTLEEKLFVNHVFVHDGAGYRNTFEMLEIAVNKFEKDYEGKGPEFFPKKIFESLYFLKSGFQSSGKTIYVLDGIRILNGETLIKYPESFNLFSLVNFTVTESNYNIAFQSESGDYSLNSYPGLIFLLLSNLIKNAVEASYKTKNDGYVNVVLGHNKGRFKYKISVSDKGSGIRTDLLSMIFKPGFSTKKDSRKTTSGIGLGFAEHILYHLNAHLEIETSKKGTTFCMYLPNVDDLYISDIHSDFRGDLRYFLLKTDPAKELPLIFTDRQSMRNPNSPYYILYGGTKDDSLPTICEMQNEHMEILRYYYGINHQALEKLNIAYLDLLLKYDPLLSPHCINLFLKSNAFDEWVIPINSLTKLDDIISGSK